MEKNIALAYQVLDYIREHPEEWDQFYYFCGTTACFAGRTLLIHLGLPGEIAYRIWELRREDRELSTRERICKKLSTWERACQALGWTGAEGDYVFNFMTRDFSELELRVKDVLNGEIRPGD